MANPIPPLFCSTPPPIDDDAAASPQNDEADFGDFTNAYQDNTSDYIENDYGDFNSSAPVYFEEDSHLKTTTAPDLFPTSLSIPPNDLNCDKKLSTHSVNVDKSDNKSEQLKKTTSLSSLSEQQTNSLSPETKSLDKADDDSSDKNFGDFQFSAINDANKDDSGRSSQSDRLFQEVVESVEKVEKPQCVEPLANVVVVLEDVTDDESDNECRSPRNRNNFHHCDEDSANFFALQPVEGVESNVKRGLENKTTKNETIAERNKQLDNESKESKQADEALKQETVVTQEQVSNSKVEETTEESYNPKEETHVVANDTKEDDFDGDDDEFANFQDFTTTSDSTQNDDWKASFEATSTASSSAAMDDVKPVEEQIDLKADIVKNDDDDDDDFGDFSEAPVYATPLPSQTPVVVTKPTIIKNSTTNLISMLELMFPKLTIAATSESAVDTLSNYKSSKHCLELAIVESAKALDYQWNGSNMRHALIRSLGIDSRNIFLAEKWNPSMPRFAANLTFDPLQPLKPTSMPLQPAAVVSSSNQKPSVPVVEFDWQSAGLVNPLDGSKTEMASQSADASNTESGASIVDDVDVDVVIDDDNNGSSHTSHATNDDDTSSASSTYASAETSTIAASAASATLPTTITGSGNIDAGSGTNIDAIVSEDLDVGYIIESQDQVESETSQPSQVAKGISSTPIFENKENLPATTLENHFETKQIDDLPFESVPIARSTFAGPLKETHIFTPTPLLKAEQQFEEMRSPISASTSNTNTGATQKNFPIDFDYEKAAAGIIIDETVVRKEYRDIEYNPGFNLAQMDIQTTLMTNNNINAVTTPKSTEDEFDDEFTDFQSVPPPPVPIYQTAVATKPLSLPPNTTNAATSNGMILSPAILLPQAISIECKQPKIEWGDSAASIDPDELARIEQLFPQDKSGFRNDSRKSTPTHGAGISTNSLSISASLASQQQQQNIADDDDWSDFVSVPVPANVAPTTVKTPTRNNSHNTTQQSPSPLRNQTKRNLPPSSSLSNEEEWSDFVSSAPSVPPHFRVPLGMPQFNSASWQNANFYNNPLSIYHRNHMNAVPNATMSTKLQQNNNYNNQNNNHHSNQNNNNNNNNTHGGNSSNNNFQQQQQQQAQYLSNNKQHQKSTTTTTTSTAQQLQQQQQIQIMQDFSTSPNTYHRPNMSTAQSANYAMGASNTPAYAFQVGSAKVAPTVSLIPDLGFVAPAMPVHTAVINTLPKPSSTTGRAAPPRK